MPRLDGLWPGPLDRPAVVARHAKAALWAGVVANVLALSQPVYMLHVYDYVLTSRSLSTLMWLTLIALFLLAVQVTLDHFRSEMLAAIADEVDEQVRARAFEAAWRGTRQQGVMDRAKFTADLDAIRGFLTGPGAGALMDLPWTPVFVVALFLLSPWLGLLCLLFGGIVLALSLAAERRARPRIHAAGVEQRRASAIAEDAFRSIDAASAMGFVPALLRRWGQALQASNDASIAARTDAGMTQAIIKGARLWLQVLLLGVAAWLVLAGQITAGAMIAASIVGARALQPLDQTVGALRSITQARLGWLSLGEMTRNGPAEGPATGTTGGPVTALPRPTGEIALEDASFAVPDAGGERLRPLVRGVSLRIPAGAFAAIVGASGSGKTTLARLMAGAVAPSAGAVRLDGADLAGASWADEGRPFQPVGLLPQTAQLLSGSVAENIRRFGAADDAGVIAAARLAGAHDMILRLPAGYDTDVGEGGTWLSGGQRTLVAFARALYGDPAVVVLDEPFNALDGPGEAAMANALRQLRLRKRTVVMVTHRPAHVRGFDLLGVMANGRLEKFGPLADILPQITNPATAAGPAGATGTVQRGAGLPQGGTPP